MIATVLIAVLLSSSMASAQQNGANVDDPMIELNLPEDLEVDVLIDYVSKRLKINIVYDDAIRGKKVTIKSPKPLPKSSLLGLLRSALQMKGLVLVDMPQPNWMKVVNSEKMLASAGLPQNGNGKVDPDGVPNRVVTQIFSLRYIDPDQASTMLKPFLTTPGGNAFPVSAQRLLIVTDFEHNIQRLRRIVELADLPSLQVKTAIIPIIYADAESVARLVKQVTLGKRKVGSKAQQNSNSVESFHDPRTNRLIIIGPEWAVNDMMTMVKELDVPLAEERSPIRFYKLVNSAADEVLETIRRINEGGRAIDLGGVDIPADLISSDDSQKQDNDENDQSGDPADELRNNTGSNQDKPVARVPNPSPASAKPSLLGTQTTSVSTERATITADTNTNTIIVVGDPAIQQVYEQLIRKLDQRRPQVLIETMIVALDTSDGFELAVDILGDGSYGPGGENSVITFSSFGVSTYDEETGSLVFKPQLGFNGVTFGPDIANIAIKALKKTGRVKVLSAPKLLINDNATGELDSTLQEPYSEVVNASSTLATTTFGGTADAGTKLTVTPHISEHNYLQLVFTTELSAFRGERIENLPPPTQKNTFSSEVTIPDGYTIVVGGLQRNDYEDTVNAVPILGELPLIKHFFRSERNEKSETTLFVFIRASIVKQDNFSDLKYLSDLELDKVEMPGNYPESEPLMIQ